MRFKIYASYCLFFAIGLYTSICGAQDITLEQHKAIVEASKIANVELLEPLLEQHYEKELFKDLPALLAASKIAYQKELSQKRYNEALSIFNLIGSEYNFDLKIDSTLTQAQQIAPHVSAITKDSLLGRYNEIIGYTLYYQGALQKADSTFLKAISIHEKVGDSASTSWGRAHFYTGYMASFDGEFKKASFHLNQALKLARLQKNKNLERLARSVIASIYSKAYLFDEAAAEREEVIELAKTTNRKATVAAEYINFYADAGIQGDEEKELFYLQKARTFTDENDPSATNFFLINYFVRHYAENNGHKDSLALELDRMEVAYTRFKGSDYFDIMYDHAVTAALIAQNKLAEAETLALTNLPKTLAFEDAELIVAAHENLERLYLLLNNSEKAAFHTKEIAVLEDSIKKKALEDQIAYYQTIYETEKRDLQLKSQAKDIELLNEKSKVRSQWYIIGVISLIGLFIVLLTIRARNYARRKQKMQASFTKDLLKTQENERARIASELHDSVGQKLLMLKNSLTLNKTEKEKEIDLVRETIKEVREMSHNLHPFQFEKLGLLASLKNMVETFQKNSNVFYSEDITLEDSGISKEKEIYVFRMLQECLTNVEKHADATACNLSAEATKNHVIFQLKDNGKGFIVPEDDHTNAGLGMKTIRERARFIEAEVAIYSSPKKGTAITLKIPKK